MYSLNYMNFKNVLASYASFMDLIHYTHTYIHWYVSIVYDY